MEITADPEGDTCLRLSSEARVVYRDTRWALLLVEKRHQVCSFPRKPTPKLKKNSYVTQNLPSMPGWLSPYRRDRGCLKLFLLVCIFFNNHILLLQRTTNLLFTLIFMGGRGNPTSS